MFNLDIHNFRSFQNQKFEFSKINILIGENSGGKSSLLKFLLSLKQTLDAPTEFNLKLKGDYTDLGNYEEVVYNKKKRNKIKFSFTDKENYIYFFKDIIRDLDKNLDEKGLNKIDEIIKTYGDFETKIDFVLTNKLDKHQTIKTIITNETIGKLEIIQRTEEDSIFRDIECDLEFDLKKANGILQKCVSYKEGFFTLIGAEIKNKISKKYKQNSDYVYYSIAYMLLFQNFIAKQIDYIRFVNPIGSSPKRFYFQGDKKASYNLIDIEKFINVIGDNSLSKKEQSEKLVKLNAIIKKFGIADEIKLVKNDNLPILALNVKTKDFWSNITDVGYGVSLQIPILFQALLSENYTRKGQTLLIEQPEVHLHPSLQAKFIETLLSIGLKNTYFIETHSEHIIRKLQVLVKKRMFNLKPEDITIHYFKRSHTEFEITSHKILKTGHLQPSFPNGFFDTSYYLVKELL